VKKNNYDVIHVHTNYQCGVACLAAFLAGAKTRISHSHSTSWNQLHKLGQYVVYKILRSLTLIFATDYCACSTEAAKFMYGKKMFDLGRTHIVPNGIDLETFLNAKYVDSEFRKSLQIPNENMVIGHIGRIYEVKNHKFLLEIAENLKFQQIPFTLLLIGDGELTNKIVKKIKEKGLEDRVKLIGVRTDIPQLMKGMDVLLLPSLYEGVPLVLIEAQASNLAAIVSKNVSRECDLGLGLLEFYDIQNGTEEWVKAILKKHKVCHDYEIIQKFDHCGYNIAYSVKKLIEMYSREMRL
jgi:glycosyltransferase EpsF